MRRIFKTGFLCLVTVLSLFVMTSMVSAEDTEAGYSSTTLIRTAEDFIAIAENPGGVYELVNSISLSGHDLTALHQMHFSGHLEGNGHTIDGVEIRQLVEGNAGLFHGISGTVRNLKIENASVEIQTSEEHSSIGILAGYTEDNALITDITVSGSITVNSTGSSLWVGGLLGGGNAWLENITVLADITVTGDRWSEVGGICGKYEDGYLKNCKYKGNISAQTDPNLSEDQAGIAVGGLFSPFLPSSVNTAVADSCEVTGSIKAQTRNAQISLEGLLAAENSYAELDVDLETENGNIYANGASGGNGYVYNTNFAGSIDVSVTGAPRQVFVYGLKGGIAGTNTASITLNTNPIDEGSYGRNAKAAGLYNCRESTNKGTIICYGSDNWKISIHGAENAKDDCVNEGEIKAFGGGNIVVFGIRGDSNDSKRCINNGYLTADVTAEDIAIHGVYSGTGGANYGDISVICYGDGDVYGYGVSYSYNTDNHGTVSVYGEGDGLVNAAAINHSDNSKNYGAVHAESSRGQVTVNGILDAADCENHADIYGYAYKNADVKGAYGTNCLNTGNVTAVVEEGWANAIGAINSWGLDTCFSNGFVSAQVRQGDNGASARYSTNVQASVSGHSVSASNGESNTLFYCNDHGWHIGKYLLEPCIEVAWASSIPDVNNYQQPEEPDDPEEEPGDVLVEMMVGEGYSYPTIENVIPSLVWSNGNFSWERASVSEDASLTEKTNYEKLYLMVKASMQTTSESYDKAAKMILTAPDGFSFHPDRVQKQEYLYFTDLTYSGLDTRFIELYPLYTAEEPEAKLNFSYTISGSEILLQQGTISAADIQINPDAGKYSFRNSFNNALNYSGSYEMDFSAFNTNDPKQFNLNIAKLSAAFSAAVYRQSTIIEAFENFGFSNIRLFNYNEENDQLVAEDKIDMVAAAFATKKVIFDDVVYNLVAVAVRGTVDKEWYCNFHVGTGDVHQGFENAMIHVKNEMVNYLEELGLDNNVTKFLITGHSRGASVADLLTVELLDYDKLGGVYAKRDNIYAYTFAPPNTMRNIQDTYDNIWNIVNHGDIVTHVPGTYGKPGQQLVFDWQIAGLDNLKAALKKVIENDEWAFIPVSSLVQDGLMSYLDDLSAQESVNVPISEMMQEQIQRARAEDDYVAFVNFFQINNALRTWNPDWYHKTVGDLITEALLNMPGGNNFVTSNHAIETYIALLDLKSGVAQIGNYWDSDYKYMYLAEIHCPVDISLYQISEDGEKLAAQITGNEVVHSDGVCCDVINESKYFLLDDRYEYYFRITGYDDGEMDIVVTEISASDETATRRINYFDRPVTQNSTATLSLFPADADSEAEVILSEQNASANTEIPADDDVKINGYDESSISITVAAEAAGNGTIEGTRTYLRGDTVLLAAIPEDGYSFIGWYRNGILVSTDAEYTFTCMEDVHLTAIFTGTQRNLGDVNMDGQVNTEDCTYFVHYFAGWANYSVSAETADINKDGSITRQDVIILSRYIANWGEEYNKYFKD